MKRRNNMLIHVTAQGASMLPLIRPGADIAVDTTPGYRYAAGDIVMYVGPSGSVVLHRIICGTGLRNEFFVKGDHNTAFDRRLDTGRIVGRVRRISYPSAAIDCDSPASRIISRCIARFGRVSLAHPRFRLFERRVTYVAASAVILWFGLRKRPR